jgi:Type II CAAX prenyl endopeptidase Rce1-like
MHALTPLGRRDAAWLLLTGAASLGGAVFAHSHLGLRLPLQSWLSWVACLCLGPLIEEWAFRANLLPELTRALRQRAWAKGSAPWVSNAVVSAAFAALHHGMVGPQAWLWFVPSWVLGMAWFRYRRLLICTGLHIWFNASLALVTFGCPMNTLAQAQSHVAQAPHEAPMSPLTSQSSTVQPVAPGAFPVATSHWQGVDLDAQVMDIGGRMVLQVGRRAKGTATVEGVATQLLGRDGPGQLPAMRFEGPLLHVRWVSPGGVDQKGPDSHKASPQEWHELTFDSRLDGWPLVAYRHEVISPAEVSGVTASLVDAKATWHRHARGKPTQQNIQGLLKALPLVKVADMPDHRDYSIVPLVPRVHR